MPLTVESICWVCGLLLSGVAGVSKSARNACVLDGPNTIEEVEGKNLVDQVGWVFLDVSLAMLPWPCLSHLVGRNPIWKVKWWQQCRFLARIGNSG